MTLWTQRQWEMAFMMAVGWMPRAPFQIIEQNVRRILWFGAMYFIARTLTKVEVWE